MEWKFKDMPNTAVITTKRIIAKESPILEVWHDENDGMWQFLDGLEIRVEDAIIVSLQEIISLDPTVVSLYNLPLGSYACRTDQSGKWYLNKNYD